MIRNITLNRHPSRKDLYQVLLQVYLCQHWIVEFKGIMQPVFFMIFFSDFVTPQKCIMSEGCWSFTLKMAVQNLGNRDFAFRWFQPKVDTDKKNTYHQYLGLENKIDKRKTTLVSQTFKVIKIKYLYFFHFWPLGQDIGNLWNLQVFTFGWNPLKIKSLFPKDYSVILKLNKQHPSDMMRFWGVTKSKKS